MFLIIYQYFKALTNTCLVFTCKFVYGKLGSFMLAVSIIVGSILSIVFILSGAIVMEMKSYAVGMIGLGVWIEGLTDIVAEVSTRARV